MKIYHILGDERYFVHGRNFPKYTVVLVLNNGTELYCDNFRYTKDGKMEILCYIPFSQKWGKFYAKNQYTDMMEKYRKEHPEKRRHRHSGYRVHRNKNKSCSRGKNRKAHKIPPSIMWAAQHPFQGGGFTPR